MLISSTLATEYLTLASQCRTVNQFNKLHIRLEKHLAPAEIGYLAGLDVQQLPSLTYEWLRKLASFSPGMIDSPQRFERQPLSEHAVLYKDPDWDEGEKSLLLAFCGNGGRLGMPTSVFLQCLTSRDWDVLVLRKGPQHRSYMAGLEGVANTLPGVVRYIRNGTIATRYKRVITLGASAGGYAAVLTALLMNTARGISICGSPPQAPLSLWLRWRLRKAIERHQPELEFVHGADSERDRAASLLMLDSFGGRLRPLPSVGEHNVLFALFKRGHIAEFLHDVLA